MEFGRQSMRGFVGGVRRTALGTLGTGGVGAKVVIARRAKPWRGAAAAKETRGSDCRHDPKQQQGHPAGDFGARPANLVTRP